MAELVGEGWPSNEAKGSRSEPVNDDGQLETLITCSLRVQRGTEFVDVLVD